MDPKPPRRSPHFLVRMTGELTAWVVLALALVVGFGVIIVLSEQYGLNLKTEEAARVYTRLVFECLSISALVACKSMQWVYRAFGLNSHLRETRLNAWHLEILLASVAAIFAALAVAGQFKTGHPVLGASSAGMAILLVVRVVSLLWSGRPVALQG
ncbi:MAG: hypothetical protein AAB074_20680 [Planctomycetota bacterium]